MFLLEEKFLWLQKEEMIYETQCLKSWMRPFAEAAPQKSSWSWWKGAGAQVDHPKHDEPVVGRWISEISFPTHGMHAPQLPPNLHYYEKELKWWNFLIFISKRNKKVDSGRCLEFIKPPSFSSANLVAEGYHDYSERDNL